MVDGGCKNKSGRWSMADARTMEKSREIKRMVHRGGLMVYFFAFLLVDSIKVIDLFIRNVIHYFDTLDAIQ